MFSLFKLLPLELLDIVCSYCETKFLNIEALETHSETIFPKCRVITYDDMIQYFYEYVCDIH